MNKKVKYLGIILPLFIIGMVIAGVIYYNATIEVKANISEPFVTSVIPLEFNGFATDTIEQEIIITNNADGDLPATIGWNTRGLIPSKMEITAIDGVELTEVKSLLGGDQVVLIPGKDGGDADHTITIAFSTNDAITNGMLHLTQKNLDDWVPEGDSVDIGYTKIGSVFNAVIPTEYENHTLVYYPDTIEGWTGKVYKVEGMDMDLPMGDDMNGGNESTYCDIENDNGDLANLGVTICNGAKLWLVPDGALSVDQAGDGSYQIDWNQADSFLFETGLITYTKVTSNSIGTITVQRLPE